MIMCSLFLHHLEPSAAVALLGRMRDAARRMVLVHDLLRSAGGWRLAWLASRLTTRSPLVRVDALRSVEAAFTRAEFADLARRAGMACDRTSIALRWPCRVLLDWRR